MPVNWAFPAAQGEPEGFLAVQGSILFGCFIVFLCKPINRPSVQRARQIFFIARIRALHSCQGCLRPVDYFRGRSLNR